MRYTILNKAILIHEDISDDLPNVFGSPVVLWKKDGTPMFMFKRNVLMDVYIMAGCDERFPPEEMEKWHNENNS